MREIHGRDLLPGIIGYGTCSCTLAVIYPENEKKDAEKKAESEEKESFYGINPRRSMEVQS
jgi:hypothetical protein